MKKLFTFLIFFTLLPLGLIAQDVSTSNPILAEYKGGGCTLFPDCNYGHCCVEHDKDYFRGGTSKERLKSDNRLYACVKNSKGWQNKLIAPVMWMGVRVFGVSFLPTPFRWGFGKVKKTPVKPDRSNEKSKLKNKVD